MTLRSIQAIFEDGVLKPTEELDLQEHERVHLIITAEAEWQRQVARFTGAGLCQDGSVLF